jgi:hypothetical protein
LYYDLHFPSAEGQWVETIDPLPKEKKNPLTPKKKKTALSFEEEIPFDCF